MAMHSVQNLFSSSVLQIPSRGDTLPGYPAASVALHLSVPLTARSRFLAPTDPAACRPSLAPHLPPQAW
ncbi:uncharacterized protein B0H18DRAFT_108124 [Fomitopsis serialis]|uniref:uncharacterized protein n=1 Tax=Fomitopsis serialis TaxID=139415 RepID=UPI002007F199|nr:uncharacterized protein B0H18DRAFT_108124 [Neoantrodia serialis]KAH9915110.1 hypothetical protein B0H18DRAFT_108124 [Neoantrodia serialis]